MFFILTRKTHQGDSNLTTAYTKKQTNKKYHVKTQDLNPTPPRSKHNLKLGHFHLFTNFAKGLTPFNNMKGIHLVSLAILCNTICGQSLHHREVDIDEQKGGLRKKSAAAHEIPHIDKNLFPRNLNELPCNVPFKTMTIEEIKENLTKVFSFKYDNVPLQEYTSIIQDKISLAEFDVQFTRVSTVAARL